jgi:hypothetical protein
MNNDPFLSSDELRALTKAGSSVYQLERLKQMNIPFTVDRYETPFVTRADYLKFVLSGSDGNLSSDHGQVAGEVEESISSPPTSSTQEDLSALPPQHFLHAFHRRHSDKQPVETDDHTNMSEPPTKDITTDKHP